MYFFFFFKDFEKEFGFDTTTASSHDRRTLSRAGMSADTRASWKRRAARLDGTTTRGPSARPAMTVDQARRCFARGPEQESKAKNKKRKKEKAREGCAR